MKNILIIKLGAIGDVFLAIPLLESLKRHFVNDKITILTTQPFVDLFKTLGYGQKFLIDSRLSLIKQPISFLRFMKGLKKQKFDEVFDFQNVDRTAIYKFFLKNSVQKWHNYSPKPFKHAFTQRADLLEKEQIPIAQISSINWAPMNEKAKIFDLPSKYVLLVPGCSPHRLQKRWPHYPLLAQQLHKQGFTPVILGGESEHFLSDIFHDACPHAISLIGQTTFYDLVPLAQKASGAIGNDTGLMHLFSILNCKSLTLFSCLSDPKVSHPLGDHSKVLWEKDLNDISVQTVLNEFSSLL